MWSRGFSGTIPGDRPRFSYRAGFCNRRACIFFVPDATQEQRNQSTEVEAMKSWNATDLILETVDELRSEALARGVRIELGAIDTDPLRGEVRELRGALRALLRRAIRVSSSGGGSVWMAAMRQGRQVRFSIHDSGSGLDASGLAEILAAVPFSSDGPAERNDLSAHRLQQLVERHGGRISYNSLPGRGTDLFLTLPIEVPEEEPEDVLPHISSMVELLQVLAETHS